MKKISSGSDLGGAPFTKEDLRIIFNSEIWSVIEGLLNTFTSNTEGLLISGGSLTPNGGGFDMAAGIVCLNGEFMRFPSFTAQSFPKYIAPVTPVNDDRVFSDGVTHTVAITKSATLVGSAPVGSQYIKISNITDTDDRKFIPVLTADGTRVRTKTIPIGDWNMDSTSSVLIVHNLSDFKKIRSIDAVLRNDADTIMYSLSYSNTSGNMQWWVDLIDSTTIVLQRVSGGAFDGPNYDSTGYNRGWITITYEE